jgi:hypothetical protein
VSVPERIYNMIRENRVVPFVGARFSFVAGFPDWFGLLRQVFNGLVPQ